MLHSNRNAVGCVVGAGVAGPGRQALPPPHSRLCSVCSCFALLYYHQVTIVIAFSRSLHASLALSCTPPPVSFSSACRSRSASSCSHHLLLFPASLSAFWPCLVVCPLRVVHRCNKLFSFTCHPGARSAKQVRGQRPGDGSAPRYLTLLPCKKVLLRTALERSALARAAAITIADHQPRARVLSFDQMKP